jgi:AraC family transcriptional regulator
MKLDTRLRHDETVGRVLRHVSANLEDPFTLHHLSRIAHFAPHYFHRIFRRVTGEPLCKYVRGLRLEMAGHQLLVTKESVVRIALDAGYQSHEGFTRAFRRRFGIPPSQFRSVCECTSDHPPSDILQVSRRGAGRYPDGEPVLGRLRPWGRRRVLFCSHFGPYREVRRTWCRLWELLQRRGVSLDDAQAIGVVHDDPLLCGARGVRYDACISMADDEPAGSGLGVQVLPEIKTTCADYMGPHELIPYSYVQLVNRWVSVCSEGGLRLLPYYEVYHRPPFLDSADEVDAEVHVEVADPCSCADAV